MMIDLLIMVIFQCLPASPGSSPKGFVISDGCQQSQVMALTRLVPSDHGEGMLKMYPLVMTHIAMENDT